MRKAIAWLAALLALFACAAPLPCAPADPSRYTLALAASGAVLTMQADGSARQPLADAAATAAADAAADEPFLAWSPDGDRLAYVRGGTPSALVLTNPQTRQSTVLRRLTGVAGGVAWAPDGARLALADGDRVVIVGRDGAEEATFSAAAWRAVRRPAWSPDGHWLAFEVGGDEAPRLAVVGVADGTVYVDGLRGARPQWRPGMAGVLLWQTADGASAETGRLMQLDIGAEVGRPVTDGTRAARNAAWSPDGALLAFIADPATLMVLDPATGANRLAIDLAAVAGGPVWSRDGRLLALTEVTGGSAALTVIDVCTGEARRVADGVQPVPPVWR